MTLCFTSNEGGEEEGREEEEASTQETTQEAASVEAEARTKEDLPVLLGI